MANLQRGGLNNGFLWVLGAFCAFALIYELAKEGLFSFGRQLTGTPTKSSVVERKDSSGPSPHIPAVHAFPTTAAKPPRYEGPTENNAQVYASPPSLPAPAPLFNPPPRYEGAPVHNDGNGFNN